MLKKTYNGAYSAFRLQNPTFAMAVHISASEAAMIPATDMLPPRAALSFVTAASVTSSLVCEESMSETRVANRRFCRKILV